MHINSVAVVKAEVVEIESVLEEVGGVVLEAELEDATVATSQGDPCVAP